ncbi:hypothetical protein [Streptomyces sp. MH60]|uniref:hypothetical protein n=1 Tax=Streptomyces sp. MH60 TaxID=1940758 RepID=UPI000D4E7716|nr:hypothetical protein [Streptomyces sp. MH60]PPS87918.1 hypothetical protein BZZ08_02617 [Streptomyces sp. MH60]
MAFSLRLTFVRGVSSSTFLFRAEVNDDAVLHLLLDRESGSVRPADEDGRPVGVRRLDLQDGTFHSVDADDDFVLLASHLAAQWRKSGTSQREVRKYFC